VSQWAVGGFWGETMSANQAQPAPWQTFTRGRKEKGGEIRGNLPHRNEAWNVLNVLLPRPPPATSFAYFRK